MSNDYKDTLQTQNSGQRRECDAAERAECLSDAVGGRVDRIRKDSDIQFRLQLTPERRLFYFSYKKRVRTCVTKMIYWPNICFYTQLIDIYQCCV